MKQKQLVLCLVATTKEATEILASFTDAMDNADITIHSSAGAYDFIGQCCIDDGDFVSQAVIHLPFSVKDDGCYHHTLKDYVLTVEY